MICIPYAIQDKESGIVFSLMKKNHYLLRLQLLKHIQKWLLIKIMIYVVKRNVLSYYKNHLEMIS